jgi:signal transduction histidine kinase
LAHDRPDIVTPTLKLPWWTWIATLIIVHLGTEISLLFKYDQGVADYYLPTALALLLINWWGPVRVLPMLYLNAVLSTSLWGIPTERWYQWFIYAIPETLFVFLSWFLFRRMFNGRYWLPNMRSLSGFLFLGILIPIITESFLLQSLLVGFGDQPSETYWPHMVRNCLGEFTSGFGLALPGLYYLTPIMRSAGLVEPAPTRLPEHPRLTRKELIELILIFVVLLASTFLIEFQNFWYIYGLVSLYVAIRFGFGPAIVTNYYIFLITYILPRFLRAFGNETIRDYGDIINIFLGASLLFVFAAIAGRVISDIRIAETKLQRKNRELDQTNRELDRFVYSVSHDLSAPLKSILGLVNISRIATEPAEHMAYLSRIESSVVKLELFIAEILDYSKNKRQKVVLEQFRLRELCQEILDNLKYMDEFSRIHIDLSEIHAQEILQDKMRLKIILNNLLSNAVKFQKRIPDHTPYIKVSTRKTSEELMISVEDNGEGIRPELIEKIFHMFYRANENARGSGLGLYIAREAAEKIHGSIAVHSEYGKGSTFTIALKNKLSIN